MAPFYCSNSNKTNTVTVNQVLAFSDPAQVEVSPESPNTLAVSGPQVRRVILMLLRCAGRVGTLAEVDRNALRVARGQGVGRIDGGSREHMTGTLHGIGMGDDIGPRP
jgi:hypothetical protein